jgi:hypothetical protein
VSDQRADVIRLLEAELGVIEAGGYGRPAGRPGEERPMFYHSLACINHWLVPGHEAECHDDCVLMEWVPEAHKAEALPCHFIPLNSRGDTVKSLEGNQERLEEAVKQWLRNTLQRLKQEGGVAGGSSEPRY